MPWGTAFAVAAALIYSPPATALAAGNGSLISPLYSTRGAHILKNGKVWVAAGVNAFDQWGASDKTGHGIAIVREVIDDISECPISRNDGVASTSIGSLYDLQDVVDGNRAQGEITILCCFSWDTGHDPTLTGKYPDKQRWWPQYLDRLSVIARQFAGQSDVWIDPWNEPFSTSDIPNSEWLSDVREMYHAVRATGNNNLVLIPCPDWDSAYSFFTPAAHQGLANVIANIHCYNGWTRLSVAQNESQMQSVIHSGWPLIVSEVGGDQWVPDPKNSILAAAQQRVPILAWSWNSRDGAALVENGSPTHWGSEFFGYVPLFTSQPAEAQTAGGSD